MYIIHICIFYNICMIYVYYTTYIYYTLQVYTLYIMRIFNKYKANTKHRHTHTCMIFTHICIYLRTCMYIYIYLHTCMCI